MSTNKTGQNKCIPRKVPYPTSCNVNFKHFPRETPDPLQMKKGQLPYQILPLVGRWPTAPGHPSLQDERGTTPSRTHPLVGRWPTVRAFGPQLPDPLTDERVITPLRLIPLWANGSGLRPLAQVSGR